MLVSLMLIAIVPLQLMSILYAGEENSYKAPSKLYSLTAYKTTASGNTSSYHSLKLDCIREIIISYLSTTKIVVKCSVSVNVHNVFVIILKFYNAIF